MNTNVTVKELEIANNLKPAEANALVKLLTHFRVAKKTGLRQDGKTGKGKRPFEYSIASSITVLLDADNKVSVTVPETEVFAEPESAATEETEEKEESKVEKA